MDCCLFDLVYLVVPIHSIKLIFGLLGFQIFILKFFQSIAVGTRHMSNDISTNTEEKPQLSTKEKFKKAVKEYGSTVIVFHVAISMVSLGSCYLLMSRYVV